MAILFPLVACASASADVPAVVSVNPDALASARHRAESGDASIRPALDALIHDADQALKAAPASVMDKARPGPSGDKHDYVSYAPYFWPNPASKDGLPYIRKDGHRNRELAAQGDAPALHKTLGAVESLGLAYYFTANEAYAQKAVRHLRVFFLDSPTRMNPNFNGAQAVRGVNDGRGTGLIEFDAMPGLVDALVLLKASPAFTARDQADMTAWLIDYAKWLAESPQASDERKAANNHGCWFDVQEVSLLLYLGKTEQARRICEKFKQRIDSQIEPDGSLPRELARADGWGYSIFDVRAMMQLARMAGHVDVDLWHYQSPTGGSIRKALDYLAVYADPQKKWPHQQLNGFRTEPLIPLLIEAESVFGSEPYARFLAMLPKPDVEKDRENLWK